jgi:hypothetical protein
MRCYLLPGIFFALFAVSLHAQSLIHLDLPECASPGETVTLAVSVELEEGARLKSYDLRLQFSSPDIVIREDQIQQGSLFPGAGPTFFWSDLTDNLLIVNAAILGPGLYVEEGGVLFSLPVEVPVALFEDIQVTIHVLYDDTASVMPSLAYPATLDAPCTNLLLQVNNTGDAGLLELRWNAQPLDPVYHIYQRQITSDLWTQTAAQSDTTLLVPVTQPGFVYRVRAEY